MRPVISPHRRARLQLERLEDRTAPAVAAISAADPNMLSQSGGGALPAVSRDGRYVAFTSSANLVDGVTDTNGGNDLFLFDRSTGVMTLVSHATGSPTTAGSVVVYYAPAISDDGRFIAYTIQTPDVPNGPSLLNVYLYDRLTGTNTLVSHGAGSPTVPASGQSYYPVISGDGRYVAYPSTATDLVPGLTGSPGYDLFLYDAVTGGNTLITHASDSAVTKVGGWAPTISADGRYVVYSSAATNLVAGATVRHAPSDGGDVYVFDRMSGSNTLVSHSATSVTTTGNRGAQAVALSADGNFIVFASYATDLVSGQVDDQFSADLFLYSRVTGAVSLVSHVSSSLTTTGSGFSSGANPHAISSDGRFVTFTSGAMNLVAGLTRDANAGSDVFLYDRTTGAVSLVSHSAGDATVTADRGSDYAVISADGRYIGFRSQATNVVSGQVDRNESRDMFLYDRLSGVTVLVSHVDGSPGTTVYGIPRDSDNGSLSLSGDGGVATFTSIAADLLPSAFTTGRNVYVYQRATGGNELVSRRAATLPNLMAGGVQPAVSADGRFVVFASNAPNLVPGQVEPGTRLSDEYGTIYPNPVTFDVFLYDRQTSRYTLVSHAAGSSVTAGNGDSLQPSISGDGRFVVYRTMATNLIVDGGKGSTGYNNVYLYDRITGTNVLVSHRPNRPTSAAGNLSPITGAASAVISNDGRYVAFMSNATGLVRGQTGFINGAFLVYLYDRVTDAITLVSHAATSGRISANASSDSPAISADGRFIAFRSGATNLVSGVTDSTGTHDDFVYDRLTGVIQLVSRSATSPGRTGNGFSSPPTISADGNWIMFASGATDLVAGITPAATSQLYLYNVPTETTTLVSASVTSPNTMGNGLSAPFPLNRSAISADGRYIAYGSEASDLAPGVTDANGTSDVYLYDRVSRTTTLVSHRSSSATVTGDGPSVAPWISADGRYVAYTSSATNLVAGQTTDPRQTNLFRFDRLTGITQLVSHAPSSVTGGAGGQEPRIAMGMSDDGSFIAFSTSSSKLVAGDLGHSDVFGYSTSAVRPVTVQSIRINDGSPQRSVVTRLTVAFSTSVTLPTNPATAFRLTRTGPGGPIGDVIVSVDLSASTALQTVARLTFSGPLTQFGSLVDGSYTLTVFGSQVSGPSGALLDGDADGTPGGDSVSALFRLFGDVNGDKAINGLDLAVVRTAFGSTFGGPNYLAYLDANGDGAINGLDLAEFGMRFGTTLP
jgi:hypothetical protein